MQERTKHLAAAIACIEGGLPERAAGHLAAARDADPLPMLIALALEAQRDGRDDDLASLLARAGRLLDAERQGISRRDYFAAQALAGILAGEGRIEGAGEAAAELADECLDVIDNVAWTTLAFEPRPSRRNGRKAP
jgi:hypothetical protein